MAVLKSSTASVTPIGGQGLGGKTRHSNALRVAVPAGAIASGDTMIVAHLPQNARLVDMILKNSSGVALNFSLGIADDAVKYRAAGALANGAVERGIPAAATFDRSILYPTTPVLATFAAAATVPAGAFIDLSMEYYIDEPYVPATSA